MDKNTILFAILLCAGIVSLLGINSDARKRGKSELGHRKINFLIHKKGE